MNSQEKSLSGFNFFTLWFGAAVSMAEILTGGLLAPLGFHQGMLAVIIGHLIGVSLLALTGVIGTEGKLAAITSTKISFGKYGSYLFSVLNILQLIGWTAVMIIAGARSVNEISNLLWSFDSLLTWTIFIGMLICLWIALGSNGFKTLNSLAVALLFILTIVLSAVIFQDTSLFSGKGQGAISFGTAVELNVIMPLSWLPLISDYTRFAKSKKGGIWGSWLGYFIGSCWMYMIGLGAAIVAGNPDPSAMMLAANLGLAALGIVVLATVTTTFLDANSAGVSILNIFPGLNEKTMAVIMGIIGTVIAIIFPIEQYVNFLYLIGSVFAPLFAVLITDYFILKNKSIDERLLINWGSTTAWAVGVILYYQFVKLDLFMGTTVPVMVITAIVYILIRRSMEKWNYSKALLKVSEN